MKDEAKAGGLRSAGAPTGEDGQRAEPAERPLATSSGTRLDDFTRTRLGTHLRAMYDQVVQQPVPDRFRDLIARLDGDESRKGPELGEADLDGKPA